MYSPIVRSALRVVANAHQDRQWGINRYPFSSLPYGMALNLANCNASNVVVAAALMHGACDPASNFTYDQMKDLMGQFGRDGEQVVHVHRQASWCEAVYQERSKPKSDWSDFFRVWRTTCDGIGYQAIDVVCSETHFLVTELAGLTEISEDPTLCKDFLSHFSLMPVGVETPDYLVDPYQLMIEYLEGMFDVLRRHRLQTTQRLHTETLKAYACLRTKLRIKGLI